MLQEKIKRGVKIGGSVLAMVLIFTLARAALEAGINGVLFFGAVAAIAGLGGYELRWIIEGRRSKNSAKEKE